MSAQDNVERILRSLHVLLSKAELYPKDPTKVIVDKEQMIGLLKGLNGSVYAAMEEFEHTKSSRDRAEREFQKHGDEIVADANHKAEDVYAAAVMYTNEALGTIQEIMDDASETIQKIYAQMEEKLKEQKDDLRKNQRELTSQLQDLVDTDKYLKIIEDRNRQIEKEKNKQKELPKKERNRYANRQTEVRVNLEMLEQLGLLEEEPEDLELMPEEEREPEYEPVSGIEQARRRETSADGKVSAKVPASGARPTGTVKASTLRSEVRTTRDSAAAKRPASGEGAARRAAREPAQVQVNLESEYFKLKQQEKAAGKSVPAMTKSTKEPHEIVWKKAARRRGTKLNR